MRDGVCPQCAGTDVYEKLAGVVHTSGGGLMVWRGLLKKGVVLNAFICGSCGYVAFHVPPQEMEKLQGVFNDAGWSRVKRLIR